MEKNTKNLHPRNKFNQDYDFMALTKRVTELKKYLQKLPDERLSLDFRDPEAVFLLNKALLASGYDIKGWEILENSLCPSIPGRLNYIHYLAELFKGRPGKPIRVMDVGTGSSIIYPLLGAKEYDWHFVATETHKPSIQQAKNILHKNPEFRQTIEIREQKNPEHILKGVIHPGEYFDAIMCNPPFYKSKEDYHNVVVKKNSKLHQEAEDSLASNFKGLPNELWFPGGEQKFITQMIYESMDLKDQIGVCSSLVSNKETIRPLKAILEYHKIQDIQVTMMHQGKKISRILSWRLS
ncbi:23S rRNA (adenine(1618)-N(6))-methyltransferase RlmF [Sphingobacterium kyonggiense]